MKLLKRFPTDVLLLESRLFTDERGHFFESYNEREGALLGIRGPFVQDNQSHSVQNVVRGLHYQICRPQGKLVRVLQGEIYDVAVDLRRSSTTFGTWSGVRLSAENRHMLWIPPGFSHGFLTLSATADVLYKATDHYAPQYERTIRWDDPELAVTWPLIASPILSSKDAAGTPLRIAEVYDWMYQTSPSPLCGASQ